MREKDRTRIKSWLRRKRKMWSMRPPVGWVRFGSLRRLQPVSQKWGYDRGQPIDRYYIEAFLRENSDDIHGHVLEIKDRTYTRQFGGERVTISDVLHPVAGEEETTIIGNLATGEGVPKTAFDCMIVTQTLHLIDDVQAAVKHIHCALKPGGVVLATLPCISKISRHDMDRWGDHWRFTSRSAHNLFQEAFPGGEVQVQAHGNVLAAVSFLHGLAAQELKWEELDYTDPDFELLLTVRAQKGDSN